MTLEQIKAEIVRLLGWTSRTPAPTTSSRLPASGQTRIDVLCGSVVDGEADGGTPPQTRAEFVTDEESPDAS